MVISTEAVPFDAEAAIDLAVFQPIGEAMLDDSNRGFANFIEQRLYIRIEQQIGIDIAQKVYFRIILHHIPGKAGRERPAILGHPTMSFGLEQLFVLNLGQGDALNERHVQSFEYVFCLIIHEQHIDFCPSAVALQAS